MASQLAQEVKRRRTAWAWFNKTARRLLSETNKLQNYTSKVNGRSGYISEKQLYVAGSLMEEVLTLTNTTKEAFADLGTVLTGSPARVSPK